jgi:hypothetical protein
MVDLIPILWTKINSNQPTNQPGNRSPGKQPHQQHRQASIPGSISGSTPECFLVQQHQSWFQSNRFSSPERRGGAIKARDQTLNAVTTTAYHPLEP